MRAVGYKCSISYWHHCGRQSQHQLQRAWDLASWKWHTENPSNCLEGQELAEGLVNILRRGFNIYFVGDSTAQAQYESIRCLLGDYMKHDCGSLKIHNRLVRGGEDEMFCIKESEGVVRYDRNDLLVEPRGLTVVGDPIGIPPHASSLPVGVQNMIDGTERVNIPWAPNLLVPNSNKTILVISTGLHWLNASNTQFSVMVNRVTDFIGNRFDGLAFLRIPAGGYKNCDQYNSPLSQLRPYSDKLNSKRYSFFNLVWRKAWRNLPNRCSIIAADVSMNFRADAHTINNAFRKDIDCVNTCLPGPVDLWNTFLLSNFHAYESYIESKVLIKETNVSTSIHKKYPEKNMPSYDRSWSTALRVLAENKCISIQPFLIVNGVPCTPTSKNRSPIDAAQRPVVLLATVPSSGSSWVRKMTEIASGFISSSWYSEELSTFNPEIASFLRRCGELQSCDEVVPYSETNPIVIKTSFPFFLTDGIVPIEKGTHAFVVRIIRNPVDNYETYHQRKNTSFTLRDFTYSWAFHHAFWDKYVKRGGSGGHVVRFEDLMKDHVGSMKIVLKTSGLSESRGDVGIAALINHTMATTKEPIKTKENLEKTSSDDLQWLLKNFEPILKSYNYYSRYENELSKRRTKQ